MLWWNRVGNCELRTFLQLGFPTLNFLLLSFVRRFGRFPEKVQNWEMYPALTFLSQMCSSCPPDEWMKGCIFSYKCFASYNVGGESKEEILERFGWKSCSEECCGKWDMATDPQRNSNADTYTLGCCFVFAPNLVQTLHLKRQLEQSLFERSTNWTPRQAISLPGLCGALLESPVPFSI